MDEQAGGAFQGLTDKLNSWLEAIISNIPNVLIALVVFFIAYRISKVVHRTVHKLLNKWDFSDSLKNLLASTASSMIVLAGLVLAMFALNLEGVLSSLLMAAGVSGLVLGLALQSPLSNSFAGIILSVKDYINVGDFVESQGASGQVKEISLRHTTILTPGNDIIFLPNRDILDNPLLNNTLSERNRMIIECSVGYESDLDKAEKLVRKVIEDRFKQEENEEVEFFYTSFGDSAVNFTVRYWVDADIPQDEMAAVSEGMKLILKTFKDNGITIPYPVRTIHMEESKKS